MSSPIEQFAKSTEAILSTRQSESEHVAGVKVKAMTTTKRIRPRSPRPVTNRRDPAERRK